MRANTPQPIPDTIYVIVRFQPGCYVESAYLRSSHGGLPMVRVSFSMMLPLMLLSACAAEQAQSPATPPLQVANPPPKESLLDCAYKASVIDAWSCVSKNPTSP